MWTYASKLASLFLGPLFLGSGLWPVMPFSRCRRRLPLVPVARKLLEVRAERALLSKFGFDDGQIATEISTGPLCDGRRRGQRKMPRR